MIGYFKEETMKYNLYAGAHKYIRGLLFDFAKLCGATDFSNKLQEQVLIEKFEELKLIMTSHAQHEEKQFHRLLKERGSLLCVNAENEHRQHEEDLELLSKKIEFTSKTENAEEKKEAGYDFYLSYTEYLAQNLKHLLEEERILMSEFWRLYTEEELQNEIINEFYSSIDANIIAGMFNTLFPYMDANDRLSYFLDLQKASPNMVKEIFNLTSGTLTTQEKENLEKNLFDQVSSLSKHSTNLFTLFNDKNLRINTLEHQVTNQGNLDNNLSFK